MSKQEKCDLLTEVTAWFDYMILQPGLKETM